MNKHKNKLEKSDFHYFLTTIDMDWDAKFYYYYRVTNDDYLQLATSLDDCDLSIRSKTSIAYKSLKQNLLLALENELEGMYLYQDLPDFVKSKIITADEFNAVIQKLVHKKNGIKQKAKNTVTPLIHYLEEVHLYPKPSGNNEQSWIAKCPSGGNHFLVVVSTTDEWGCGYCKRKGKLEELKKWLSELKSKKDQKRLTKMLKEIKIGNIQTKETLKWWINRY
jgi:hypothetical protein